ncbi:alpha/beta hydrolase [Streptomyces bathyalis]|uniref:Alpha/beta hydrolase n=1 Tax=Streptomyces bathyalis TaxID=2710756 RepID=A0A7T1T7X5_9ACTN|nr:alpha/beta hydrolase [Streptomyces bathyalis]QPP07968.1 alpha/beta hydrolase [Streptomyces bathyalis]
MDLSERFEWEGRRIAWGRAGSGPAVVFCHGTPFSSALWKPFADALSRDFTVYLWDMPGYGQSSKHEGHPVDFGTQAEAFAALMAHWQLDRPHVIAHDFGGAVSLRAHLFGRLNYSSLMLVDVVAIPPSGSPFFQFVHDNPELLGQLPAYIHEAIVRSYISNASHQGLRDDTLDELAEPWTGEVGQPAFYRQIAEYDEQFLHENEKRLDNLTIPVRVVWGTQDSWIPPEIAHRLHALITESTLALVPDAGHLIHYDEPAALMDEIRAWLDIQRVN